MDEERKPGEPHPTVTYWLNEIGAARKREKDYRSEGQRILDIYEGKKTETTPFNILFSNTETMSPALYSAIPRPIVQRRFKDEDPLGKAAAQAGQRLLEFLVDTNIEGYETFDQGMKSVTLDGLLPGRGVTSVKYDFEEGQYPPKDGVTETFKQSELVCVDTRSWNRVFFGYAKKWSKVPWVAYEEHIDKKEAERLFGKEVSDKINFTVGEDNDEEDKKSNDERNTGERKTAMVYQIWNKENKKVCYISSQYTEGYLKEQDDPLQLTGFFNCPKPLQFIEKSNDLMPVAPYVLYENQAKELNRITMRINRIVEAIKAKGIYDSELGEDIKNLVEADDNQLVPADKSSSLAAEKGLQNAIWYMPLDVLVGVLEKLYAAREQCKRVIYEVTGISDIIRGSTAASETATAQRIKSDWGTLRLKRLQKEVQRYARDMLRMMLEIAATKFSEETWAKMTGLPFVTTQQRAQTEQVVQAVKMQAMQMAQTGQQPTPQQTQQVQQLQAEMAKPVWGQVIAILRDDVQRAYRIDIETNSTVEPEAVEDQKQISDVMTALGQYLNGVTPLVTSGAMPFQAAQSMMLAIVRRFRFGNEIEDQIKAMQPPKPPDDGKEAMAQKTMQSDAKVAESTMKAQQAEAAVAAKDQEYKLLEKKTALDIREIKLDAQESAFDMKKQFAEKALSMKADSDNQKLDTKRTITDLKNTKFQTENVVNKKADETLGSGVKAMQGIVEQQAQLMNQLMTVVAQQSVENRELIGSMVKAVTAPRRNKAIRGKDGKISETVSEVVQ